MDTQLFITKIAVPIITAWDLPAILFDGAGPFTVNGAMYRLLSWSDTRDARFNAVPPKEGGRLLGFVSPREGTPRAVSFNCALYALPGSHWSVAVCAANPAPLLKLLLASMAAHIHCFYGDDKQIAFDCELLDNWAYENSRNLHGYDARVFKEERSFRDICDMYMSVRRHICKTPLRDRDMRVAGVVTVREELKGAEPEIARVIDERLFLENTVGHAPSVLFSCRNEEDFPIDYISKNIARYKVHDDILLGGGTLGRLFGHDESGGLFYEINKNYGSSSDFSYEHTFTLQNGERRNMKTCARFVADRSGHIVSLEGRITDIGACVDAELAIKDIQRPLQDKLGYSLLENISPIGNEVSLYDVVDITETQDRFAKTFGVGSAIVDLAGIPITQPISYNAAGEVCGFLNFACGQDICRESCANIAKMASVSGHNEVLRCKATGFTMTAAPVKIGERVVAAWVLCQMPTGDDCGKFLLRTGDRYGVNAASCEQMLDQIPRFGISKFERARLMLDLVAEQVSILATRGAQVFVQQEIAGQSRVHKQRLYEHETLLFNCFRSLEAPGPDLPRELLESIARKLKFDRAYYYRAGSSYTLQYEWFGKVRLPAELRIAPLSIFPKYDEQKLEIYEGSKIMETQLKRYAELSGAKCAIHMPVVCDGQLLGVLGLDELTGFKIFFEEDHQLLSSLLGIIAAMLKKSGRKRSIAAAERCLEDVRALDTLPVTIM